MPPKIGNTRCVALSVSLRTVTHILDNSDEEDGARTRVKSNNKSMLGVRQVVLCSLTTSSKIPQRHSQPRMDLPALTHMPLVLVLVLSASQVILPCDAGAECHGSGDSNSCKAQYGNSSNLCCKCSIIDCENAECVSCPSSSDGSCSSDGDCQLNHFANTCFLGTCWVKAFLSLMWAAVGLVSLAAIIIGCISLSL